MPSDVVIGSSAGLLNLRVLLMKKVLLAAASLAAFAGSALAADLPTRKEPAYVPPPPPLWTGFYVGLNAGGTFGNNSAPNATTWNINQSGGNASLVSAALLSGSGFNNGNAAFIGGGQMGYNWQFPYGAMGFVYGVEADIQGIAGSGSNGSRWTAANANRGATPYSLLSSQQGRSTLQYLGTVRGRIGYLATPTLLLYGTGGLAYGGIDTNVSNYQPWTDASGGGRNYLIGGNGSFSNTQVGWTGGGGVEWMFLPNWSVKAEYLYYDLGRISGTVINNFYGANAAAGDNGIMSASTYQGRATGNVIRAGLNYHITWATAPIVAKY